MNINYLLLRYMNKNITTKQTIKPWMQKIG